jgi:ApaG protein
MGGKSGGGGSGPFTAVTRGVRVTVRSYYLADQSQPERGHHVWAYRVTIANEGRETVQLLKRSWLITDGQGRTQHVHGDGVVGEQPVLEPGENFEYTSGTPLATPSGFMRGTYHMVVPTTGEGFDAAIPSFSLDSPLDRGAVH